MLFERSWPIVVNYLPHLTFKNTWNYTKKTCRRRIASCRSWSGSIRETCPRTRHPIKHPTKPRTKHQTNHQIKHHQSRPNSRGISTHTLSFLSVRWQKGHCRCGEPCPRRSARIPAWPRSGKSTKDCMVSRRKLFHIYLIPFNFICDRVFRKNKSHNWTVDCV